MIGLATGALVDNSAIVICGGYSTRKIEQKKCYIFDKSNQWQLLGHMKTERVAAASIQVPNGPAFSRCPKACPGGIEVRQQFSPKCFSPPQ